MFRISQVKVIALIVCVIHLDAGLLDNQQDIYACNILDCHSRLLEKCGANAPFCLSLQRILQPDVRSS